MIKKHIQEYVEYGGFRFVDALVRLFPVDISSWLMGKAWKFIGPKTKRHKRALDNLRLAYPDMSDTQRETIARQSWESLGRTFGETFVLHRILRDPARIENTCVDEVVQLEADQVGAVVVSMHAANWELTMWPAVTGKLNPACVYQRVRNKKVDDYIRSKRQQVWPGGMFGKTRSTARDLHRWVSTGGHLGMLTDHREIRGGIEVSFFGHPAMSSPYPAALARQCRVPLLVGRTVRKGGVKFLIECKRIDYAITEDKKADIAAATQAIHSQLEEWIKEYPQQWMWIQRRWHQAVENLPENMSEQDWKENRMQLPDAVNKNA